MTPLAFDYSFMIKEDDSEFIGKRDIDKYTPVCLRALTMLDSRSGQGKEFTGWLDIPRLAMESPETTEIEDTASEIIEDDGILVVIGIGGSYLGARAVIESLSPPYFNELHQANRNVAKVYFAGNNVSGPALTSLIHIIDGSNRPLYTNVISKSGTTLESNLGFRVLYGYLRKKFSETELKKRIIVTTDSKKGALFQMSSKHGWNKRLVIPDDVGGRFSVFSPVGLLPIAVAGINIRDLLSGASSFIDPLKSVSLDDNPALAYALTRNILYQKHKQVEIFTGYEPAFHYLAEWWKQLAGESEGKQGMGIVPTSIDCTTDLHSLGQFVQEGSRNIFETILLVKDIFDSITIPRIEEFSEDELGYLEGRKMIDINQTILKGSLMAHYKGGVPCGLIEIDKLDAKSIGGLLYFFQKGIAISAYMLGVNPFDQPGVAAYKDNVNILLGNPSKKYQGKRSDLEEVWRSKKGRNSSSI